MNNKVDQLKRDLEFFIALASIRKFLEEPEKQEIKLIIDQLMNNDVYHDEFLKITDSSMGDREFDKNLLKLVEVMNLKQPANEQEANFTLLKKFIRDVVEDRIDPMQSLYDVCYVVDYKVWQDSQKEKYAGEYAGVAEFFSLNHDTSYIEELKIDNVPEYFNPKIHQAAKIWWDKYKDHSNF